MNFSEHLENLRNEGNFRELPRMTPDGVIDFSTNDYLGLGADAELQDRFFADPASLKVPMTSSASRLLAGRQIEYDNLEVALRLLYSKRRGDDTGALLFNSGYHANTGLIPAIASKGTYIIADRLVHASIIDGIILSKAPFTRFRHNDYGHLRELLARHCASPQEYTCGCRKCLLYGWRPCRHRDVAGIAQGVSQCLALCR